MEKIMTWDKLTNTLRESGALSADWEQVFRSTPRDRFTPDRIQVEGEWIERADHPDRWAEAVTSDVPLVTQVYDGTNTPSSSSSMPTVVATMLRHLDVAPRMRVLEVGTGTGWTAGLLTSRVGAENVVTIEADPGLAIDARAQLATMGRTPTVLAADGMLGYPVGAPYDLWVRDQRPDSGDFDIDDIRYGPSEIDPADIADSTDAAFAIGLRMSDLFRQSVWAPYDRLGTGRFEIWDGVSYAHCRLADWKGKHAVSQSGPRNLWDEVTAAYGWWQRQGSPSLHRFGLTVSVAGEHQAWLDDPDNVIG
ncbi:rRNA adenine N-6-methyltransferase family protein [Kitasatospora misakiensis]|uniref:Protein-L-isoaspartate O-methyltransferase n=1 Tax=Kitasatospora misakiensis TaxID=67330 RepID=A0ABW0WZM7_9ACTN